MSATPRAPVLVSAGVLIEDGRVLVTRRQSNTHLAGAWEFPGGKVEPGEDPRRALERELEEELGIACDAGDVVEVTHHRYPTKDVLLLFFRATRRPSSPAPRPLEVADLRWARASELDEAEFPPADLDVLRKVRGLLAV